MPSSNRYEGDCKKYYREALDKPPRFALDSDYIEELKNNDQDLDFRVFREMSLRIPQEKIAGWVGESKDS